MASAHVDGLNDADYLKRFSMGFYLSTDSDMPLVPDLPPEGLPVESASDIGGRYHLNKWELILPHPRATELFRIQMGKKTGTSIHEWGDLLKCNKKYVKLTLYKLADRDNLERVFGFGAADNGWRGGSDNDYILTVNLNLEWAAQTFKTIGNLPIDFLRLTYLFLRSMTSQIELRDSENEIPTPNPPGFLLKLYDYQARTLTWMRRIESGELRIKYHKEYYHALPDPTRDDLEAFCYVSSRDVEETAKTMAFYQCFTEPPIRFREFPIHGGLLADIMGNGKTVTGIAHICSQRALNGRDTYPVLKPGLEQDIYLPSRATLILCPNNILDQWYSEFQKCLGPALGRHYHVLKLGTIKHLKAASHWDIINADVVISSYSLLSNPNHVGKGFVQKYGLSTQFTEQRSAKHKIPELTDSPVKWDCSIYEELEQVLPTKRLYLYKFYRIIHDEFHEVINIKTRTNCLLLLIRNAFRATYYWGFSGTPILERETVLENLPHLLQFQDDWGQILPMNNGNKELFFDKCVIKNTKRHLPPLKYQTVSIMGTDQEKQLYETLHAATSEAEQLVRFACYHNLSGGIVGMGTGTGAGTSGIATGARSLLSAETVMAREAQSRLLKIEALKNSINDTNICLSSNESSLKSLSSLPKYPFSQTWQKPQDLYFLCDTAHKEHNAKVRVALENDAGLRRARDLLREYRKETKSLKNLEREKQNLEKANALYEKFKNDRTISCSLCAMEGKCDQFLSLPECQHSACTDCMDLMCEGSQRLCPICRKTTFKGDRLARLAGQDTLQNQNLSPSGLNITLWGSKICSVVDKLVDLNKDDKVLIFAQWPDLLDQLRVALCEVGIECVAVEGTTASRSAAIRRFQTDPICRAILLSSVHGTSGINLVEGNHVFLIHHFLGSSGKEYEYQAICRAYRTGQKRPVTVTHFIREDTLERALHEKRTYTNEAGSDKSIMMNDGMESPGNGIKGISHGIGSGKRLAPLVKPRLPTLISTKSPKKPIRTKLFPVQSSATAGTTAGATTPGTPNGVGPRLLSIKKLPILPRIKPVQ